MKKKMLASAIFMAVASVGFVMSASAEEHMSTDVAPVLVEGQQEVLPGGMLVATDRVGILGDMKAIDVPFTERQYSQKTIEMFENPNQPMNGVLANNPSIVITSHNPLTTDFAMRGMNMNGTQYSLNNVPSMFSQFMTIPTHVVDSIDITSGPNTVLNGATNCQNGANNDGSAAAGRLNATTKKATDKDINRYVQKFSGRGTWTEGLEVGRRFGKNKEWGVLVNARQDKGALSMKGGYIEDKSVYANVDRRGEHGKTNIFGGYFDKKVEGAQRWLNASAVAKKLPAVPDLKKDFSFDGQTKNVYGYMLTLNHEQRFGDKWSAFANAGFAYAKQHYNDYQAAVIYFKDNGDLTGSTKYRDYYSQSYTGYLQAGATNTQKFKDGQNQVTVAYDYMNYRNRYNNNPSGTAPLFKGNILSGIIDSGKRVSIGDTYKNTKWSGESVNSLTIADKIEYKKSTLFASAQYRKSDYNQCNSTTNKYTYMNSNNWNPTFAYAYKPEENLSLYASYSTSFTRARVVTGGYTNDGDIFDPIKNKQSEIGVKYENGGVLHSLAMFQIKQGSYIAEGNSDGTSTYTQNGENKYKGVEYYATGKVAPKWNLMGGFMYLNGVREKLADVKVSGKYQPSPYNGSRTTGAPRWNFTMAAEYEMDKNNIAFGRINSCTDSVLNNAGVRTPGYTTVDLGYTHKLKLGANDVKLNATCYNVFGKDYWLARGSTNSMTLGAPRTFVVSATFDF